MKEMTKAELYDEFETLLEFDSKENLLKYVFDYFSSDELERLLNHIKEEKAWEIKSLSLRKNSIKN